MGTIKGYAANAVTCLVVLLYLFGMYRIIVDDHRYTSKQLWLAGTLFPYAMYIGAKEAAHFLGTTSAMRGTESECMDALLAERVKRNVRVEYCTCYAETENPTLCQRRASPGR